MLVVPFRHSIFALLLLLLAGCAANGPVLGESVTTMRAGVAQAKTESGDAFADINASRRDFAIEDVLDANRAPDEKDFAPVIDQDTAGRWNEAFDRLDEYFAALLDLVDAKRSEQTGANLTAIGTALQSETIGAQLPRGSSETFAALGQLIVQASAENKALKVMQETDPAFQRLMRKMGDLVSSPDDGTLSALVRDQWQRRLNDIAADDYGAVKNGTRDQRAAVIRSYADALDQRNVKLAALASLRASLLALGEAHAAAAKGSDSAVLYWISQLNDRLKEARQNAESGGN